MVLTSLSSSFTISFVYVRSVSYVLSFVLSNTYMISYFENESTYSLINTQSEYEKYFPYIIRFLSPVYVPTVFIIPIKIKNKISREKLIGIVCGSVSVFFLILGIIILSIKRKYFIDDTSYGFSCDSYSNSGVVNDSDDSTTNVDYSAVNL